MKKFIVCAAFSILGGSFMAVAQQPSASPVGQAPASTNAPLTPQETVKAWNGFENKTFDEVLPLYEATTPDEKLLARAFASAAVSEAKLQKMAGTQWGDDAETLIAHLCATDTKRDDAAAAVTVTNDHAVFKYDVPDMAPLLLVRIGGVWKVDVAGYIKTMPVKPADEVPYCYQCAAIYDKYVDDMKSGKYQNVKDLAADLKKAMDALDGN